MRDAFFWRTQVAPGAVVAVKLSEGWGPHTRRDDVLFIGSQDRAGVHATLDAATVRRAQRHHPQLPPLHPPQPLTALPRCVVEFTFRSTPLTRERSTPH